MRILFVTLLICSFFVRLTAQTGLHTMVSRAPLPTWVNSTPAKTLMANVQARTAMGNVPSGSFRNAMAEAVDAQYSYLNSGRLLFNDDAGILANKIADSLLRKKTAVRKAISIYVAYNSSTNAVVFPNGFIVIDLGVFAQMENESQLAFFISHEIAHFINGDFASQEEPYIPESFGAEMEKYLEYKRIREREADLLAYELYEDAGYDPIQVLRMFYVMERNWLVPEEISFAPSFFHDSTFQYPAGMFPGSDTLGDGLGENYFSNSTHESYLTRSSALAKYFKLDSSNVVRGIPNAEFVAVNKLAIYNCGIISLENQNYALGLYLGYYLHVTDTALRDEADLLIAKAIYLQGAKRCSITKDFKADRTENFSHEDRFDNLFFWNDQSEEPQDLRGYALGVNNFFNDLTSIETSMLAVKWSWDYSQRTSKYREPAKYISDQSMSMLSTIFDAPADSLGHVRISNDPKIGAFTAVDKMLEEKKIDNDLEVEIRERLRKKKNTIKHKTTASEYYLYKSTQLLSLVGDSAFISSYTNNILTEPMISASDQRTQPSTLGADSVFLIGSNHIWTREKKRSNSFKVNEELTEQKSIQSTSLIHSCAKGQKIKLLSANPPGQDSLTLSAYNDYCIARRVFSEIAQFEQQYFTVPLAYKEQFDSVAERTHTYHAITDLLVTKQFSKIRSPALWVVALIIPYTTAFALIHVAIPKKFTYHQTLVYNLKTGNLDWVYVSAGKGVGGGQKDLNFFNGLFKKIKKPKSKSIRPGQ